MTEFGIILGQRPRPVDAYTRRRVEPSPRPFRPVPRRIPHEFYPTPPEATRALLSVERFDDDIWEPACGEGHICRVLTETGHCVVATDLNDRGFGITGVDFLKETVPRARHIVTNPPYGSGLADAFITSLEKHASGMRGPRLCARDQRHGRHAAQPLVARPSNENSVVATAPAGAALYVGRASPPKTAAQFLGCARPSTTSSAGPIALRWCGFVTRTKTFMQEAVPGMSPAGELQTQPSVGLEPDYAFALYLPEVQRKAFFLVEIDRGTMPIERRDIRQSSIARKLIGYQSLWKQKQHERLFGWRNFRVLFVTTSAERAANMIAACDQHALTRGSPLFLFGEEAALATGHDLLASEWRDGYWNGQRLLPKMWRE